MAQRYREAGVARQGKRSTRSSPERRATRARARSNVRGIDEYVRSPMYMPSRDATFDAVLSFWSLNHAIETRAVIGEAARVL